MDNLESGSGLSAASSQSKHFSCFDSSVASGQDISHHFAGTKRQPSNLITVNLRRQNPGLGTATILQRTGHLTKQQVDRSEHGKQISLFSVAKSTSFDQFKF